MGGPGTGNRHGTEDPRAGSGTLRWGRRRSSRCRGRSEPTIRYAQRRLVRSTPLLLASLTLLSTGVWRLESPLSERHYHSRQEAEEEEIAWSQYDNVNEGLTGSFSVVDGLTVLAFRREYAVFDPASQQIAFSFYRRRAHWSPSHTSQKWVRVQQTLVWFFYFKAHAIVVLIYIL